MGPVVIYLVVHKLLDGSVDAARAFVATADLAASHPQWITLFPNRGRRSCQIEVEEFSHHFERVRHSDASISR
jgi:hypothetical protein